MQALAPAENAEAQKHLDTCAICRRALADLIPQVSLIGLSAPQQALPDGARGRFFAAAESSAQAVNATTNAAVALALPARGKRRTGFGWFGWTTTVAALVVAISLGHHSFELQRQLDESRDQISQLSVQAAHAQQLQSLMDALASPEAKQVTLTETKRPAQPVGHVTYLPKNGALVFVANNLRPVASENKAYELWLIPANGKGPIPAGLFRPNATGSASVVLPSLPLGVEAKAFAVTVEQSGGAATPTLPIVMTGQQ